MKKIICLCLAFLVIVSVSTTAQTIARQLDDTSSANGNILKGIKVSEGNYTELQVKKALIHTRLRYGWKMTEHSRYSMTLEYKKSIIRLDIDGANIKMIDLAPDQEPKSGWLSNFEKLYIRRLSYYKDESEAASFIQ